MDEKNSSDAQRGLDISIKEYSIHITESSSMSLPAAVLKAVRHAANIAKCRGGVTLESTIETQNIVMPE